MISSVVCFEVTNAVEPGHTCVVVSSIECRTGFIQIMQSWRVTPSQVCYYEHAFSRAVSYGHEDSCTSNWLVRRDINHVRSFQPDGACELDLILAGGLTR